MAASEQTDQNLLFSFEKSASAVRHSFRCGLSFETEYIRPVLSKLLAYFQTFLAIFAAFSALPVLSFLGFSLFVFTFCIFIALVGALCTATLIVVLVGFFLAGMLTLLLVTSLFLTACAIGVYLALRFAIRIRNDGALAGTAEWAHETKEHFLSSASKGPAPDEDLADQSSQTIIVGSVPLDAAPPQIHKHEGEGDGPGRDTDTTAKEEPGAE
ncbi:hypothetical protein B0H21DRAFT_545585 [Amylocystis lapponica]|nr:hypothetical protein B0H21DRAFT_545585 [Amylocystis lapponica]